MGEHSDIFIHTLARASFLGVHFRNFEFQYFLGVSEKRIFRGYEAFVDFFWGGGNQLDLSYMTLNLDPMVISVIWITHCLPHLIYHPRKPRRNPLCYITLH